ncbi:hypothetical protein A2767_06305 [Candidatus Roizmanbacteria bacterium RIFCSPHIGHO2_01_FULL_35_10]|nr:MAG: hypothetical protein A2767_06305 [Candidatus Roizmanbacteria bacterium RIFCSPHIGHO2_01_FULL_35_10]
MKVIYRLSLIIIFVSLLTGIIAFARGYRVDFQKQSVTSTGIIAVSAFPKASKVLVNGELKGVSDINLTLPPGNYEVEVRKDGYTSWKKTVDLKGELVLSLDILLYPLNPSLSPLTNLSIIKAVPIVQSNKIILFSENDDATKDGIYLFEESLTPIPFFTPLKILALKKSLATALGEFSLNDTTVDVAPDTKEAIFTFKSLLGAPAYLLSLEEENISFFDISSSKETLIEAWTKQKDEVNQKIFEAFPAEINKVASDSFRVIEFSPDETKLLYLAKLTTIIPVTGKKSLIAVNQTPEIRDLEENSMYVYDKKEDRNYKIQIPNSQLLISNYIGNWKLEIGNSITWYTDSKHLVINEGKKISLIDFDNQNKQTVYSGIFDGNFFKVATDGKILILTNLNPEANRFPDLYAVGIR